MDFAVVQFCDDPAVKKVVSVKLIRDADSKEPISPVSASDFSPSHGAYEVKWEKSMLDTGMDGFYPASILLLAKNETDALAKSKERKIKFVGSALLELPSTNADDKIGGLEDATSRRRRSKDFQATKVIGDGVKPAKGVSKSKAVSKKSGNESSNSKQGAKPKPNKFLKNPAVLNRVADALKDAKANPILITHNADRTSTSEIKSRDCSNETDNDVSLVGGESNFTMTPVLHSTPNKELHLGSTGLIRSSNKRKPGCDSSIYSPGSERASAKKPKQGGGSPISTISNEKSLFHQETTNISSKPPAGKEDEFHTPLYDYKIPDSPGNGDVAPDNMQRNRKVSESMNETLHLGDSGILDSGETDASNSDMDEEQWGVTSDSEEDSTSKLAQQYAKLLSDFKKLKNELSQEKKQHALDLSALKVADSLRLKYYHENVELKSEKVRLTKIVKKLIQIDKSPSPLDIDENSSGRGDAPKVVKSKESVKTVLFGSSNDEPKKKPKKVDLMKQAEVEEVRKELLKHKDVFQAKAGNLPCDKDGMIYGVEINADSFLRNIRKYHNSDLNKMTRNLVTLTWNKSERAARSLEGRQSNRYKTSLPKQAATPRKLNMVMGTIKFCLKDLQGMQENGLMEALLRGQKTVVGNRLNQEDQKGKRNPDEEALKE